MIAAQFNRTDLPPYTPTLPSIQESNLETMFQNSCTFKRQREPVDVSEEADMLQKAQKKYGVCSAEQDRKIEEEVAELEEYIATIEVPLKEQISSLQQQLAEAQQKLAEANAEIARMKEYATFQEEHVGMLADMAAETEECHQRLLSRDIEEILLMND